MANIVIGLDGEMSSADLSRGGRLIQIGVAFDLSEEGRFCSLIGWDDDDWVPEARAMTVHGITAEQIAAAPRAAEVDERLYRWLLERGGSTETKKLLCCGWNVVAFDLPFVADALPRSMSLISRRGADLNGITLAMADNVAYEGSRPGWSGWKRLAKRAGERALREAGIEAAWHDAGFDAAAALASYDWLRSVLGTTSEA